ncbi:MAG: hypothetical protein NXI24_04025 [bacterium]|nr:hypothetical protein [bacterium]
MIDSKNLRTEFKNASPSALAVMLIAGMLFAFAAACEADKQTPPVAPAALGAVEECQLSGYVAAPEGVAIRGLDEAMELLRLPPESIVTISGVSEGRLRISRAVSVEEDVLFSNQSKGGEDGGDGWIAAGFLVTGTEPDPAAAAEAANSETVNTEASGEAEAAPPEEAGSVAVYAEIPDGRIVGRLAPYDAVNILGCRGDWAYIEGTGLEGDAIRGWLAPESQCPNPVTSCS